MLGTLIPNEASVYQLLSISSSLKKQLQLGDAALQGVPIINKQIAGKRQYFL